MLQPRNQLIYTYYISGLRLPKTELWKTGTRIIQKIMLWHHSLMSEACIFCKPTTHLLRNLYTCIRVCVCVCTHMFVLSCVWLCNLMDYSLPGSSVHGISRVRILEWVAISGFRGSSWPRAQNHVSCIFWIGRWILYHCATWEALYIYTNIDTDIDIDIYTHTSECMHRRFLSRTSLW